MFRRRRLRLPPWQQLPLSTAAGYEPCGRHLLHPLPIRGDARLAFGVVVAFGEFRWETGGLPSTTCLLPPWIGLP